MKTKVKLSQIIVLLLLLFLLPSQVRAKGKDFNLAYNSLPFNLPSLIEHELGFLAQAGFNVRYHTFGAGHAMTEAMASGSLDLAPVMGATSTIVSRAGGRQIKIIGVYSQAPQAFALATKPGAFSLDELQGKSIAVPIGTEAHLLLAKILAEQGLKLSDIQLVNLLIPDGIGALHSNQVDATMVVEPMLSRLVSSGTIEVLRTGEGLIHGLTLSVVPSDRIQHETTLAFQRAHEKSLDYLEENYEEVLSLAVEKMNLPVGVVKSVAEKYTFRTKITEEIRLELAETIDFLVSEKIIRNSISLEDLF